MGPFSSIRAPFGGSLLRYRNQAVLRERTFVAGRYKRCMTRGHQDRREIARGVCATCYNIVRDLVEATIHTWEDFETAGVVRPVRDTLTSQFLEAVKNQ